MQKGTGNIYETLAKASLIIKMSLIQDFNKLVRSINPLTIRAPKELQKKRFNTCINCHYFIKNVKPVEQCDDCGCFVRLKLTVLDYHCPLNYW